LDYARGPEKTWVYGALRVTDGQAVTMTAASRNSLSYQKFLAQVEKASPNGKIVIITDNLSSHNSVSTRDWLAGHQRIGHAFIPVAASRLNRQEAWWRIFRRHALPGTPFAPADDTAYVTSNAPTQLNQKARPWIWGRPPPPPRRLRRRFVYTL